MHDSLRPYEECIERLRRGDEAAREELFDMAYDRLVRLTRKMLHSFPTVKRWEQTDDVWQNAGVKLWQSLDQVELGDTRHFLNLAALQIRRQLLDLARHYGGAHGLGRHHVTPRETASGNPEFEPPAASTPDASHLAEWTELHHAVDRLPDDEREVFQLIWYQGLPQADVAALLGVTVRTIKRRWQSARFRLADRLQEIPPLASD